MAQTQVRAEQIKDGDLTDANVATANIDGAANVPSLRTLGTGANQALPGNTPVGGTPTSPNGSVSVAGSSVVINQNWLSQFTLINGYIDVYLFGGFVTLRIKNSAGNVPSAADPVYLVFRHGTASDGTFVLRPITASLELVFANLANFGIASTNGAARLWVICVDKDGTGALELGVINCWKPNFGIYRLREDFLITTNGMSDGATSAHAPFTFSSLAQRPFRILGYIEWGSGFATTVLPTKIQGFRHGVQLPGDAVQKIVHYDGASNSGTGIMSFTTAIPQNTQGNQFLQTTIQPTSDSNVIRILNLNHLVINTANTVISAVFRDNQVNALMATCANIAGANLMAQTKLEYMQLADALGASITYKSRSGDNVTGTTYFNRTPGTANALGGVFGSCLNLEEIMA